MKRERILWKLAPLAIPSVSVKHGVGRWEPFPGSAVPLLLLPLELEPPS